MTKLQEMEHLINDRYQIIKKLGEGRFGEVYLAQDTLLKQEVALKRCSQSKIADLTGNPAIADKYSLFSEISRAFNLNHRNVLRYHHAFRMTDEKSWTETEYQIGVMEYIKGGDLKSHLNNPHNISDLHQIFHQILQGIAYLHQKDIIHRDLKPSNILIQKDGQEIVPKIMDFGISKELGKELASSSILIGTVEYMAPERVGNSFGPIGPKQDIWSFGIMMYYAFTGTSPFHKGEKLANDQLQRRILEKQFVIDLSMVPHSYLDIIDSCLQRTVSDRKDAKSLLKLFNQIVLEEEPPTLSNSHSLAGPKNSVEMDSISSEDTQSVIIEKNNPQRKIFIAIGTIAAILVAISSFFIVDTSNKRKELHKVVSEFKAEFESKKDGSIQQQLYVFQKLDDKIEKNPSLEEMGIRNSLQEYEEKRKVLEKERRANLSKLGLARTSVEKRYDSLMSILKKGMSIEVDDYKEKYIRPSEDSIRTICHRLGANPKCDAYYKYRDDTEDELSSLLEKIAQTNDETKNSLCQDYQVDTSGTFWSTFDEVRCPSEGMCAVRKGRKWGFAKYIDAKKGKTIITPGRFAYDEVTDFEGGFAWVRRRGLQGLVKLSDYSFLYPQGINTRSGMPPFEQVERRFGRTCKGYVKFTLARSGETGYMDTHGHITTTSPPSCGS